MANASQRHKLETRGYNSIGGRKALQYIKTQHGSNTVPAVLVVEGLWSSTDTITVTVNIGGGDLTPNYSPSGNEDAVAAATGIASAINGQTDVTATSDANHVYVTKSTAGSVDLVSAVVA
jgi:hypothetical protein